GGGAAAGEEPRALHRPPVHRAPRPLSLDRGSRVVSVHGTGARDPPARAGAHGGRRSRTGARAARGARRRVRGGRAGQRHDHVWVIQRPRSLTEDERGATLDPPRSLCCAPAPSVLEFDADGTLLRSWGGSGAGYEWPLSEHGIFVDYQDNVWIGGNDQKDHQVLKFTADGKFLLQIGKADVTGGDHDTAHLGRPANMSVDPATNGLFVADGYKNHRVIIFDAQTGAYKRHWGANG